MWRKSSYSYPNGDPHTWRKSSHSNPNGACIECGEWTDWEASSFSFANGNCVKWRFWRKSSYSSANGQCLEVRRGVQVRDSKLGEDSPVLSFTAGAWAEFLAGIR
jgi:Domain of unknown function (DUF397)